MSITIGRVLNRLYQRTMEVGNSYNSTGKALDDRAIDRLARNEEPYIDAFAAWDVYTRIVDGCVDECPHCKRKIFFHTLPILSPAERCLTGKDYDWIPTRCYCGKSWKLEEQSAGERKIVVYDDNLKF